MFKKAKRWFQDKIGIGENRDKIYFLEKRVKLNHALLHLLLPDNLQFDARNRPLPFFNEANGIDDVPYVIHKNDLMFLGILYNHEGDMNRSLNEYFSVGYKTTVQIRDLLADKQISSFLDFGAGYGRVARFLPVVFPGATITASDIKEESVRFCEDHLKLKGYSHETDPASVDFLATYDALFAGSVFTHLPEKLAYDWLVKLSEATNPGGTLIFSIHNIKTYGFAAKGDFYYHYDSEDAFFSWVDDSIKDQEAYGTAYMSVALAEKWMAELGFHCTVLPQAFGGTQDLVVATKKD